MAFFTLEEAIKLAKDPIVAGIFKTYADKNPLAQFIPIEVHDDVLYKWRTSEGVGGGGRRKVNGGLHEGTGSKTHLKTAEMTIYNEVRNIDRIVAESKTNAQYDSLVQRELKDAAESIAKLQHLDWINSDKNDPTGDFKFDGLLKLAANAGSVFTVDEGGVAAALNAGNIYDNLTLLGNNTTGDAASQLLVCTNKLYSKINKFLKESKYEVTVATNNFGRKYTQFMDMTFVPMSNFVIDAQGGEKQVVNYLPTVTFDGVANTERIICVTVGENNVHAVRLNDPKYRVTELDKVRAGEHPKVDVEDAMLLVDKAGSSVSVLEGIIL